MKDLPTNKIETFVFDAIFVCNGHNSVPFTPDFDGVNEFQAHHMHSHDYRRADAFKGSIIHFKMELSHIEITSKLQSINFTFPDKIVLIIGGGPSGVDLTFAIAEHAKTVIFSHHTHNQNHVYPANVIRRGTIRKFTRNGAIFDDGHEIGISDVIFCTGNLWLILMDHH